MCAVSYVGDYFRQQLPQQPYYTTIVGGGEVTRAEFELLKRDIEELKKLLTAAKKYDEATGQPDCEHEDKVALIKKLAKLAGVDMKEIFE